MQRLRIVFPLIVAQILLVNLGDSLHHASWFGFHDTTQCCHCSCSKTSGSTKTKNDLVEINEAALDGNCLICDFFDVFTAAVFDSTYNFDESAIYTGQRPNSQSRSSFRHFNESRGPPAFLFLPVF